MVSISEHYIFLETGREAASGTRLLTRPVGIKVDQEDILVAIDGTSQKHLLIPKRDTSALGDSSSQGVEVRVRRLQLMGRAVDYIDVGCKVPRLDLVFERLADDLVSRLAKDSSDPAATTVATLDEWRALLRTAKSPADRETIVGLVGELELLRLLAQHNVTRALDTWRGPSAAVHDFVNRDWELEVKTTTSVDGNFVTVSNLDQLDPNLVQELHLVVVHARDDESAPSLDERIDSLVSLGIPRDALILRVERAGYVYESDPQIGRLSVRSVRAWRVGATFPGLRGTDLEERRRKGVSRVRYDLALDAAPPRLPDSDFEDLLRRWVA